MFYSTEILCDKRYALSTVWRAGNTAPGARTTGIRRKVVLDVSVERACGTIKDPPGAPIALRLQGTLLYGTARIYQEQCRYVLADSERTQRAMAKLGSGFLDDKLDNHAGQAKSVQIVLPDDPSFDVNAPQLPPFDFDTPLDALFDSQPRQSSWTNFSLVSRSSGNTQLSKQHQLVLNADSSADGSYAGGFSYSASGASHLQDSPTPLMRALHFPEEDNFVDVGLFMDENGNIIEQDPLSEPELPAFLVTPSRLIKRPSWAQNAAAGNVLPLVMDDEDMFHPPVQAAADVVDAATGHLDKNETGDAGSKTVSMLTHTSSSSTCSSPSTVKSRQANQRASRKTANFLDGVTQIPLRDYFRYIADYPQHMKQVVAKKERARLVRRANDVVLNRDIAYRFTFGRGIFGVANVVTGHDSHHPLAEMFSGATLEEALFGDALDRAKRRKTDVAGPCTPEARRQGHKHTLDGLEDDPEIERGRQPGSALSDNPSLALNRQSSVLPGSSARGSAQHSTMGIHHHSDGRLSSVGFPESPSFIHRLDNEDMELPLLMPGSEVGPLPPTMRSSSRAFPGVTRGGSGGVGGEESNAKLGEEMRNTAAFYELVQTLVTEEGLARAGWKKQRWVDFDKAVAAFKNNRGAVVGAFMSLLALASARKVFIQQDPGEDGRLAIDRDIFIGVKPKLRDKGRRKRTYQQMSEGTGGTASHLASEGELRTGGVSSSPAALRKRFFGGSKPAGIALTGTA